MIGVYGANGFIGRHLLSRLDLKGIRTRAVSRRIESGLKEKLGPAIQFVEADLNQPLEMASSLQRVETVVQLISSSSPSLMNEHIIVDLMQNVVPHVTFLETCVRAGVKRIIFLSSGGTVYGPWGATPSEETQDCNPVNSHGLTKLMVEKYISMYGYVDGLEYVILRVSNPYGPGQKFRMGQGLIPALLECDRHGTPVQIFGDGSSRRDYIYVDDVIDAIEKSIFLPGSIKTVLNIGSGELRSVMEVVQSIESATGRPLKRQYVKARATDVDIASMCIAQAKKTLNWTPHTQFDVGIARTVVEHL